MTTPRERDRRQRQERLFLVSLVQPWTKYNELVQAICRAIQLGDKNNVKKLTTVYYERDEELQAFRSLRRSNTSSPQYVKLATAIINGDDAKFEQLSQSQYS